MKVRWQVIFSKGNPPNNSGLRERASTLTAKPMIRPNGDPFGTFALWHRSCREMPAIGKITTVIGSVQTSTYDIVLGAMDDPLSEIPPNGFSLFDCLSALPPLRGMARLYGIEQNYVRGFVERNVHTDENYNIKIHIHPGPAGIVSSFFDNCFFDANFCDRITFTEFPNGGIITVNNRMIDGRINFKIPHGMNLSKNEVCFWPKAQRINEFGYFYIALFIVGNYARYYPDHWLRDIDMSADISLAIEDLIVAAKRRIALLTFSELSGTYFVPEE